MEHHGCLAMASFFLHITHLSSTPGTITVDGDARVVLLAIVGERKPTGTLTVQTWATWSDLNFTGNTKATDSGQKHIVKLTNFGLGRRKARKPIVKPSFGTPNTRKASKKQYF